MTENPVILTESQANQLELELSRMPPDYPAELAPPGRAVRYLERHQLELVLIAVEGMAKHVALIGQTQRVGSRKYIETAELAGKLTVIANQIRRQLAEPQTA